MFKALLNRATRKNQDDSADPEELLHTEEYLSGFRLTHTGAYHLERLRALLMLRYQQDLPMTDAESIQKLIVYAVRVQDRDVQRELLLFYLNCPPETQDMLRSQKLIPVDEVIAKAPNPFEW